MYFDGKNFWWRGTWCQYLTCTFKVKFELDTLRGLGWIILINVTR